MVYLAGGGGGGGWSCCQATARPPCDEDSWVGVLTVGVDGVDGELLADDDGFFSADLSGLAWSDGSLGPCARTQPTKNEKECFIK